MNLPDDVIDKFWPDMATPEGRAAIRSQAETLLAAILAVTPKQPTKDMLIEAVARVIDPSSWRVMDSYLVQTKRKYRGQNVGWPADQYQHKESMAIARAVIPVAQAPLLTRIAELEAALENIKRRAKAHPDDTIADRIRDLRHIEGCARNALRSTQ